MLKIEGFFYVIMLPLSTAEFSASLGRIKAVVLLW